ncbi:hypothetical protein Salat_0010400 [Sesamum alatum]|uniref:Uncharacterized protein n=1 Tax=Sesamum alatum TaxID=300844 RepID=A0AAE1YUK4_9LAMI|nr:hypothetical protein Salat_0010400 [Sesamum alatum]
MALLKVVSGLSAKVYSKSVFLFALLGICFKSFELMFSPFTATSNCSILSNILSPRQGRSLREALSMVGTAHPAAMPVPASLFDSPVDAWHSLFDRHAGLSVSVALPS